MVAIVIVAVLTFAIQPGYRFYRFKHVHDNEIIVSEVDNAVLNEYIEKAKNSSEVELLVKL